MKFKKEHIVALCRDEYTEEFGIEEIERFEWKQSDPKRQSQRIIFKHDGKFYSYYFTRSGSPFSDWYYDIEYERDEIECKEVKKEIVQTHIWKAVND